MSKIDPKTVIYVDESGIQEFYHRHYAYAVKGQKVEGKISGKKYSRTNIVAGLMNGKIVAENLFKQNMEHKFFEDWFENILLKNIPKGSTIVLDRASFHRKKHLPTLAEKSECKVLFLCPYSPDFNPIEKYWANLKKFLRTNMHKYENLFLALCFYFKTG